MTPSARKNRAVTIERVAAQAGVSKTTVSFVLNDNPSISAATREKVFKVIEELGYQPNTNARNLSTRTNHTICVVLPEMGHVFEDPYFARAMSGIYDEVEGGDYRLMLRKASYDFAASKEYINLFRRREVAGMLYLGSTLEDGYLADFLETSFPFVFVNSLLPDVALPHVIADYVGAGYLATKHLLDLGHRRIAHIAGSMSTLSARDRLAGYRKALAEAGIAYDEKLVPEGHFSREESAKVSRDLLAAKRPPTAFFASNDNMAYGVFDAVRDKGLSMPEDVSVVGGDCIECSAMIRPTLTSVEQPIYEIARESVRLLLDLIEGEGEATRRIWPSRLVVRASTGPVPARGHRRVPREETVAVVRV